MKNGKKVTTAIQNMTDDEQDMKTIPVTFFVTH